MVFLNQPVSYVSSKKLKLSQKFRKKFQKFFGHVFPDFRKFLQEIEIKKTNKNYFHVPCSKENQKMVLLIFESGILKKENCKKGSEIVKFKIKFCF